MIRKAASGARAPAGAVDVVVIGAGHSGLAMSYYLSSHSIEHVVLERGEVANSWRYERWDSLKLLTPNGLCRLPGHGYSGADTNGFMSANEVVGFIGEYAARIAAPVHTGTTVTSVRPADGGYRIVSNQGAWQCRAVVIASGACNLPLIPAARENLPGEVQQLQPLTYRNPSQVEPGAVLVVGASATGLQIADELQRAGHEVMLSAGEHVRMPRTYRGRDIQWWMQATGLSDHRYDEVDDLLRARRVPSPQLIGSREQRFMDLNRLAASGVRIVGRLAGVRDGKCQFSGSLQNVCALADLKMNRLLAVIDDWIERNGRRSDFEPAERFEPTRVPQSPCLSLDMKSGAVRSVFWATGFRPDYSWLDVPVLDRKGWIRHDGGIAASPGLYVMGLPFLRRRKSSFIHGAGDDARELCDHVLHYLGVTTALRCGFGSG